VDDLADAAHRVLQHVVGVREGLLLRDVVAHDLQQLLVEHHDEAMKLTGRRQAVRSGVVRVNSASTSAGWTVSIASLQPVTLRRGFAAKAAVCSGGTKVSAPL
jgi:hypothetical protein